MLHADSVTVGSRAAGPIPEEAMTSCTAAQSLRSVGHSHSHTEAADDVHFYWRVHGNSSDVRRNRRPGRASTFSTSRLGFEVVYLWERVGQELPSTLTPKPNA